MIICRSIITGFEEEGIYPATDPKGQFADSVFEHLGNSWFLRFTNVLLRCLEEQGKEPPVLKKIWDAPLVKVKKSCSESTAANLPYHTVFGVLDFYASNATLGNILITFTTPKVQGNPQDPHLGRRYMHTLFGNILSLSVLPKQELGPYEYFQDPSSMPVSSLNIIEGNVHATLQNLYMRMHSVFKSLLTVSKECRNALLVWIGNCLLANKGRSSLGYQQTGLMMGVQYVPDGFMLNLGSVLQLLSEPFCREAPNQKILRVNPWYTHFSTTDKEECVRLGIHTFRLNQETMLVADDDVKLDKTCKGQFSFITDCFYLSHMALSLGFGACLEKYNRLNTELSRFQQAFHDAQNRGGPDAAAQIQAMKVGFLLDFLLCCNTEHVTNLIEGTKVVLFFTVVLCE